MSKTYVKAIKFSKSGETYYVKDGDLTDRVNTIEPNINNAVSKANEAYDLASSASSDVNSYNDRISSLESFKDEVPEDSSCFTYIQDNHLNYIDAEENSLLTFNSVNGFYTATIKNMLYDFYNPQSYYTNTVFGVDVDGNFNFVDVLDILNDSLSVSSYADCILTSNGSNLEFNDFNTLLYNNVQGNVGELLKFGDNGIESVDFNTVFSETYNFTSNLDKLIKIDDQGSVVFVSLYDELDLIFNNGEFGEKCLIFDSNNDLTSTSFSAVVASGLLNSPVVSPDDPNTIVHLGSDGEVKFDPLSTLIQNEYNLANHDSELMIVNNNDIAFSNADAVIGDNIDSVANTYNSDCGCESLMKGNRSDYSIQWLDPDDPDLDLQVLAGKINEIIDVLNNRAVTVPFE